MGELANALRANNINMKFGRRAASGNWVTGAYGRAGELIPMIIRTRTLLVIESKYSCMSYSLNS